MSSYKQMPPEHNIGEWEILAAPPLSPISPVFHSPSSASSPVPIPASPFSRPNSRQQKTPISFNRDVLPSRDSRRPYPHLLTTQRRESITKPVLACDVGQLVHADTPNKPRLKRDFLRELPLEVAIHLVGFIDDGRTVARAAQVSRFWNTLVTDEWTWKTLCDRAGYGSPISSETGIGPLPDYDALVKRMQRPSVDVRGSSESLHFSASTPKHLTYEYHYKLSHLTHQNWAKGGRLLRTHKVSDDSSVTCVAMDDEWIVIGLQTSRIHVFSFKTGQLVRTLVGHTLGVWALGLVSKGGVFRMPEGEDRKTPEQIVFDMRPTPSALLARCSAEGAKPVMNAQTDACNASSGWGQSGAIVVSGGCDREVRVWDLTTGNCLHVLKGHTSTIRCLKVLDARPIAVSGSRDTTVRVWDIARGRETHILQGHTGSVRCLEISGSLAVSGSYDSTCRLWDVDSGECLRVFRGHYHALYSVSFDGKLIAAGSLDTNVRIWNALTGDCVALLHGHTSLVSQTQLLGNTLVTGGSDGRIIVYDTTTLEPVHRINAYDNSVACLRFDRRYIVSGGSDGSVKMYSMKTGKFVREMTSPCDAVWRVSFREDRCVIVCCRSGRTFMEIWTFKPTDDQLHLI